jgi:outer membrane immunogenic protein
MFKLISCATLAVGSCASTVWAADLSQYQAGGLKDVPAFNGDYSWNGFFAGVNSGYAFDAGNNMASISPWLQKNGTFEKNDLFPEGGFEGGQLGYNFQFEHFVAGVETGAWAGHILDDVGGDTVRDKLSWLGTVEARAGYLYRNAWFYGTGGFAVGGVKNQFTYNNGTVYKNEDSQVGFIAGGGVEYKVSPNWSFKAEYQYVGLGRGDLKEAGGGVLPNTYFNNDYDTMKLGINYHFGQFF